MIPIRIYYHVTLINDWDDITKFIFDKIVDSGLMDECEGIYVGALGDEIECFKLQELLLKYPKAVLKDHNTNKNLWEAHTLQHLKNDADKLPLFYALYCHSKSVTYPPKGDGKEKTENNKKFELFWRDYMVNEVITRWGDCYTALDLPDYGYDTAGCRMIPKRKSGSIYTHASGNMWWANSEYIKTLPKFGNNPNIPSIGEKIIALEREIDEVIKSGEIKMEGEVFFPEMWLWQQQPLTYISCNAFTVGFPYENTFEETVKKGFDIQKYRTR